MDNNSVLNLNHLQLYGFDSEVVISKQLLLSAGYDGFSVNLEQLQKNHYNLLMALEEQDTSLVTLSKEYSVSGKKDSVFSHSAFTVSQDQVYLMIFTHVFLSGLCKVFYHGKRADFSSILILYPKITVANAVKLLPKFKVVKGNTNAVISDTIVLTDAEDIKKYSKSIKTLLSDMTEKMKLFCKFVSIIPNLNVLQLPYMQFISEPVFLYLMDLSYCFGLTYKNLCNFYGINIPDQTKILKKTGYCLYVSGGKCYYAGKNTGWEMRQVASYDLLPGTADQEKYNGKDLEVLHALCGF